ncbi:unnamed protein product [Durusdinium trenchii]|uniref:Uncharacterized protein n=1 Tax=Durusdinium trenchii TaxID=1381693 RepID=A0ABP0RLW6_9DINO
MAAAALVGRKAAGDCCKSYDAVPMLWPYQFPECGRSWCPSCWNSSDVKSLPVHTFAALGYAASLAVSSPKATRRLTCPEMSDRVRRGCIHQRRKHKKVI